MKNMNSSLVETLTHFQEEKDRLLKKRIFLDFLQSIRALLIQASETVITAPEDILSIRRRIRFLDDSIAELFNRDRDPVDTCDLSFSVFALCLGNNFLIGVDYWDRGADEQGWAYYYSGGEVSDDWFFDAVSDFSVEQMNQAISSLLAIASLLYWDNPKSLAALGSELLRIHKHEEAGIFVLADPELIHEV